MYWTYVLWSARLRKRYTGATDNVHKRLLEHNRSQTPFTSRGIPWILIHHEPFATFSEAKQRERFLKSGVGRQWLDQQFPQYTRSNKDSDTEGCESG
ncbi:MAG: GIY-YIG nuclease family protein [Bacteroidota bacterium]